MKVFRISTLIAFAAAVASGTGLFVISQRVQRAERHLAVIADNKVKEESSIRVLRAEWDYLNRPDRLEALANQYLGMQVPVLSSVTSDPDALTAPIPVAAPTRKSPVSSPMTQPAVYHAPPVPASPPAEQPQPPDTPDQSSFDDLIHNLSNNGGAQ